MQPGGQSIVDRILAAKNTIAGQLVAKVVCKATTEELIGPKRKHLDCLLQATHEMNVSIPEIADLLIERSQNSSWIVSFKALITIHHLMSYGNERFEAYMASHNHHLQSPIYTDRIGLAGGDMTMYLRHYAAYLCEKRDAYKLMGYDFCKIKRGKDDALLRTMPSDKLLKAVPILQKQLDALLNFEIAPNELINGVINSCFLLLIKDLIYLYAAFNDAMINLLEKYFTMNKKQCREALEMYKKFIDRTDKVSYYLKIAERYEQLFDRPFWGEKSGVEGNEIAELPRSIETNKAPANLLEALENHLAHIEGKKLSSQTSVTRLQTEQDVKSFPRDFPVNVNLNPHKILEEEAKALEQFHKKKEATSPPPPVSPPVAFTTSGNGFGGTDFFSQHSSSNGHHHQQPLFSDDLFSSIAPVSSSAAPAAFAAFDYPLNTSAPKHNLFDDILQPTSTATNKTTPAPSLFSNSQNIPPAVKPLHAGDLNSSLNQLIDNLDIKDHSKIGKDHQWTPNDNKGQQKLGAGDGMMHTPGITWPKPAATSAPFGSVTNLPSNAMWQPPSAMPSSTNPFAASNGASHMHFGGMANPANPFAATPSFATSPFNQPPANDLFGNL